MKTIPCFKVSVVAGVIFLALTPLLLRAAPLGTVFTYQGRLADGGSPATGRYDLRFTLFDSLSGGVPVGSPSVVMADATSVANGLFVVSLDFGPAFSGQGRWLSIEVKTNRAASYFALTPRTELTATPQAVHALRAGSADAVSAGAVTSAGLAPAAVTGAAIADGSIGSADLSPALANGTFWKLGGNTGGGSFLGSVDNQPVEIRANNQAALRVLPGGISPNLAGGHAANAVVAGSSGAVIGGGGSADGPNTANGDFATIAGGQKNSAVGRGAFVGGGSTNRATATAAVVGGNNNNANATYSAVGGGQYNSVDGIHSVIAGGFGNEAMGDAAVVGGGYANLNTGDRAVLAGGEFNTVTNDYAVVGGGRSNTVGAVGTVIAGGLGNLARGLHSVIGGGLSNHIPSSRGITIGGGMQNIAQSQNTTVAGGFQNYTDILTDNSSIGGGWRNQILFDSTPTSGGTISGGTSNRLHDSSAATIAGGYNNGIAIFSGGAAIGGGRENRIEAGSLSATIGGGFGNQCVSAEYGVASGGLSNLVTGAYSTIPGGAFNSAGTGFSFAAGRRAKANHVGSFVWADTTDEDFASTTGAQFAVRANNGVVIQSTNRALELRGGGSIRVVGAGVNTATPFFTHRALAANTSGAETRINHPHCDGKPNAILIVTYNFNPAGLSGTRNDRPVGIYYNGSQWAIYNLDGAAMPVGAAYNVLVANP